MQFPMLIKKTHPFNQTKPTNFTAHKAKISETIRKQHAKRLKTKTIRTYLGSLSALSTGIWDH